MLGYNYIIQQLILMRRSITRFPDFRAAFSNSATLYIKYKQDQVIRSHLETSESLQENLFTPVVSAVNIRRPGISHLHRHHPLKVPIHTLFKWSLRDSFLVVHRDIHVCSVQDTNRGPLDLHANALQTSDIPLNIANNDCIVLYLG